MKKLIFGVFTLAILTTFQSCSTSNDVVSNSIIQKRKFNKGYHFNGFAKKQKKANQLNNELTYSYQETPLNIANQEANINNDLSNIIAINNLQLEEVIESTLQKEKAPKLSFVEKVALKRAERKIEQLTQTQNSEPDSDKLMYIIIAFFIPFVAVGLVTDWDVNNVLLALLLTFLCWIPGFIYALKKINEKM